MASWNQTPENRCLPILEWPEHDQVAWQAALQPAAYLAAGGVAAAWSDAGRRMVMDAYGRWLAWLQRTDQLNPEQPPERRVTPDRVRAYGNTLAKVNAPMTVQGRIGQLGRAMRALAPNGDWRWLSRISDRLRAEAVSVREKRTRMQEANELVELGARLMCTAASTDDHFAIQRAGLYRDGLIIVLLALRPLRLRTLAAITVGQHLSLREDVWWLSFGAADTKTRQPMEMPFPAVLVPALELYLAHYRSVLLVGKPVSGQVRPATDGLWIARGGQMMGKDAIRFQVTAHTERAFGKSVHPHLFRDCVATTIAIEDPEHVRIIAQILGHTTLATAERHYNQAGTLEASRRYHATLRTLRHDLEEET